MANEANEANESDENTSGLTASTTLTAESNAPIESADDHGVDDMAEDPRIEQVVTLIRAMLADADERAAGRIIERLGGPKTSGQTRLFDDPSPDKRAPRGSAAVLIDRALSEAGDNGLTVLGIQAKAETDFEKMITTSAIRNWLKENERKRPQKYRQVGGVWFLARHAPTMKVVG